MGARWRNLDFREPDYSDSEKGPWWSHGCRYLSRVWLEPSHNGRPSLEAWRRIDAGFKVLEAKNSNLKRMFANFSLENKALNDVTTKKL